MTQDFFNLSDLYKHSSLIDPYFIGLTLSKSTKHNHSIDNWCCICGIHGDGRIERMFDVWCGIDEQYRVDISYFLYKFCQEIGIEFK